MNMKVTPANIPASPQQKRELGNKPQPASKRQKLDDSSPSMTMTMKPPTPKPQATAQEQQKEKLNNQALQLSNHQLQLNTNTIVKGLESLLEIQLNNKPGSTHQWRKSMDSFMQRTVNDVRHGTSQQAAAVRMAFAQNFRCNPEMMNFAMANAMRFTASNVLRKRQRLESTRNLRTNQNVQMLQEGISNSLILNASLNPLFEKQMHMLDSAQKEAQRDIEDAQKANDEKMAYDRKEDEENYENRIHELQTEPTPTDTAIASVQSVSDNDLKIAEPRPEQNSEALFDNLMKDKNDNEGKESNSLVAELCKETAKEQVAEHAFNAFKTVLTAGA